MIDVTGLDSATSRIASLASVVGRVQAQTVRQLGDTYLKALQAETPVRTGQLRGAYQTTDSYSEISAEYRITNTTPYLKWVVNGRGPVEATSGKALRFVINGQVFFRKRVGPAKANPFPARAARTMAPYIATAQATLPGLIVRSYGA